MGFGIESFVVRGAICGFIIISLAGCLGDDVKPHNGALGAEVSEASVEAALAHALDGISITNAHVGDCATYQFNYRINADPVIMSQVIKHKLLSVSNTASTDTFNLFEDLYEYAPSGALSNEVHRQLPLVFDVQAPPKQAVLSISNASCDGTVKDDGDGVKYDCIRYFNFEADDRAVAAPPAVAQKPNCLGFANCQIPVHHIIYDAVKFLQGQQVNKVTIEGDFSSAIPDLLYVPQSDGSIVYTEASTSFCTAEIVTGGPDNSNYLLRQCFVLQDIDHSSGDCSPPTP